MSGAVRGVPMVPTGLVVVVGLSSPAIGEGRGRMCSPEGARLLNRPEVRGGPSLIGRGLRSCVATAIKGAGPLADRQTQDRRYGTRGSTVMATAICRSAILGLSGAVPAVADVCLRAEATAAMVLGLGVALAEVAAISGLRAEGRATAFAARGSGKVLGRLAVLPIRMATAAVTGSTVLSTLCIGSRSGSEMATTAVGRVLIERRRATITARATISPPSLRGQVEGCRSCLAAPTAETAAACRLSRAV